MEGERRPEQTEPEYALTEEELSWPWEELFKRAHAIEDKVKRDAYYKRGGILQANEKLNEPNYGLRKT